MASKRTATIISGIGTATVNTDFLKRQNSYAVTPFTPIFVQDRVTHDGTMRFATDAQGNGVYIPKGYLLGGGADNGSPTQGVGDIFAGIDDSEGMNPLLPQPMKGLPNVLRIDDDMISVDNEFAVVSGKNLNDVLDSIDHYLDGIKDKHSNLSADRAPTATDDSSKGYEKGSAWLWGNILYICTNDATGNASWHIVTNENISTSNIFTETTFDNISGDNLNEILQSIDNIITDNGGDAYLKTFITRNVEEIGNLIYVGRENPDGHWMVKKVIDGAIVEITYAMIGNNPTYTSYTTAWNARSSLVYEPISSIN